MIVAVVNADDFGLSPSINEGIGRSYENGILRSASLMPNGEGFADAVDRIKDLPGLGVGIHLSLVGERAIAPPGELRSLVSDDGWLPASYADFTRAYYSRKFALRELRREIEAQIARVLDAGIRPTHLDSHQHIHLLPGVLGLSLELAKAGRIGVVRAACDRSIPAVFRSRRGLKLGILRVLSALARARVRNRGLRCAGSFHGLAVSGHLNTPALCGILSGLKDGVHEIMCHPGRETPALRRRYGWGYEWEAEAEALRSAAVKELVERRGIRLRNFDEAWRDEPSQDLGKKYRAGRESEKTEDPMKV
jgi:chitin disaccharide deacetylase